jgi:hypothetical protein
MEEAKERPHFWMWGDPVTVRNPIRERWEAEHKAQPMSDEAKAACAKHRAEKQERRALRRGRRTR